MDGAVELITAQFPLTDVDSGTLARTGHENNNERTGLFIDARCRGRGGSS
jgi:hypothetical protein